MFLAPEAYAPYCIVMWSVWFYQMFPLYLINSTIFGTEIVEHKIVSWLCLQICLKCFTLFRYEEQSSVWSEKYIDLDVKYPLFLSDLNKTCIFYHILEKCVLLSVFRFAYFIISPYLLVIKISCYISHTHYWHQLQSCKPHILNFR
jgi:hypothetical protein